MTDNSTTQDKSKKSQFPKIFLLFVVMIFFALLFWNNQGFKNIIFIASGFIKAPTDKILSFEGRTNLLVMGVGGKSHVGGDLTDTMMVISISITKPGVTIISLPRDLWIPQIRAKINSAYHYGGASLAKESAERVVGFPIHYTAVVDFSSFKSIIDALGGVEVQVDNAFSDPLYPIAGKEDDDCGGKDPKFLCRYETVSFESGLQSMDGERALKFVRSRHAEGDEGTDTAREARQQKIIDAIKTKILNPRTLLNINKDKMLWKAVISSIETDINPQSTAVLARKFYDSQDSVNKYLIPEELLINPPITKTYDSQYVFIPKLGNGNWSEINKWILEKLK